MTALLEKRSLIRITIAALSVLSLCTGAFTYEAYRYPKDHWEKAPSPETLGYSSEKLEKAEAFSRTIDTAAVMIVVDGVVLDSWGETTKKFNVHSIRKSFLSALYGIHVNAGTIDLSKTMEELGIDDNEPSLSDVEKKATVHQLLKARSGVYHLALYESAGMKAGRPERHSHEPGTHWYYNNWDFNVAGEIFRNLTKTDIFREFKRAIAGPVGMQDFEIAERPALASLCHRRDGWRRLVQRVGRATRRAGALRHQERDFPELGDPVGRNLLRHLAARSLDPRRQPPHPPERH